MKFKFSTLVFSLANLALTSLALISLTSTNLHAKNVKLLSKDPVIKSFFSAADNTAQTITGPISSCSTALLPPFISLTFKQHRHQRGRAIKSNGYQFHLKKGTYLVSFTGTFTVGAGEGGGAASTNFDIALQLGPKFIFANTNSQDTFIDTAGLVSFTKIIKVDEEHQNLSVVVRTTTPFNFTKATTRSITIEKLT